CPLTYDTFSSCHCTALHRHLLSFPTRRSSDLRAQPHLLVVDEGEHAVAVELGLPHPAGTAERCAVALLGKHGQELRRQRFFFSRSEEHTSELQSRVDLVCRLLLEKKKIKNIFHTLKNLLSPFRKHPAKLGMVLLEVVAIALVCI